MNRIYLLLFLLVPALWGAKVEIFADTFEAKTKEHISIFTGNVRILKEEDRLFADRLTVYTDEQNRPNKYVAHDNIRFVISNPQEASVYEGNATKLIYLPKKNLYELYTDVVITQRGTKRVIRGDMVVINAKTGGAKVIGKKKEPIRITFEVGEEEEK